GLRLRRPPPRARHPEVPAPSIEPAVGAALRGLQPRLLPAGGHRGGGAEPVGGGVRRIRGPARARARRWRATLGARHIPDRPTPPGRARPALSAARRRAG